MKKFSIALVLITVILFSLAGLEGTNELKSNQALHRLNQMRVMKNLPALELSPTLNDLAEFYAGFLAETGGALSHDHFSDDEIFRLFVTFAQRNRETDLLEYNQWGIWENLARYPGKMSGYAIGQVFDHTGHYKTTFLPHAVYGAFGVYETETDTFIVFYAITRRY